MVTIDDVAFPLDPTNAEQAGDWDGDDGAYWATYHREYERLLGVFDAALVEAGAVRADDRVLDVGCGTGATSRALAAHATEGAVLGLDLSGPMLAIARAAADRAGVRNVEFLQGDAQVYPFDTGSFDVVVSRMGCMFFGDPAQGVREPRRGPAPRRTAGAHGLADAGGERVDHRHRRGARRASARGRRAQRLHAGPVLARRPGPVFVAAGACGFRRRHRRPPSTSRWLSGPWTTPGPSSRPGWRRTSTPRRTHARRRRSSGC